MTRVWVLKIVVLELEQGGLQENDGVDEVEEGHMVSKENVEKGEDAEAKARDAF